MPPAPSRRCLAVLREAQRAGAGRHSFRHPSPRACRCSDSVPPTPTPTPAAELSPQAWEGRLAQGCLLRALPPSSRLANSRVPVALATVILLNTETLLRPMRPARPVPSPAPRWASWALTTQPEGRLERWLWEGGADPDPLYGGGGPGAARPRLSLPLHTWARGHTPGCRHSSGDRQDWGSLVSTRFPRWPTLFRAGTLPTPTLAQRVHLQPRLACGCPVTTGALKAGLEPRTQPSRSPQPPPAPRGAWWSF